MASFAVNVDINSDKFPEIGSPMSPVSLKDAKPNRALKDEYNDYLQEQNTAYLSGIRNLAYIDSSMLSYDSKNLSFKFNYETETSKTYKFLGMDIDENYDAVVKLGTGHIVVGSMYDKTRVIEALRNICRYKREGMLELCVDILDRLSQNDFREISTAIKAGIAYSLSDYAKGSGYIDMDRVKVLLDKVSGYKNSNTVAEFKSILLNLVHSKKIEQEEVKTSDESDTVYAILLAAIMRGWSELVEIYNGVYSMTACLDLWTNLDRKLVGDEEFFGKFRDCVKVSDNATGELTDRTISFSGVSKDGSASDANVVRRYASESFRELANAISNESLAASDVDYGDILLGFADVSGIDDIYSLTKEEIQALNVLDSLQYIDEDAVLCKESYDMNNPDERGLFVKSSIRSYERNFKEFKPANNYDVTEALADMVDRGDISSKETLIPDSEVNGDTEDTIVTSSRDEIKANINIKDLQRVMKLVFKSTSKLLSGF